MIKKISNSCSIAPNGYPSEPKTTDHAHNFTTKENEIGPGVEISAWSKLAVSKEEFLSNNMKEQRFIFFLSENFKHFVIKTFHA